MNEDIENQPRRLLAVDLNYLGDALFTTPALAALRAQFPRACIDVLAGERAAAILHGVPGINRLWVRPPRGGAARVLALADILREGQYDATVLFQSILSNAALAWAARVPIRVGFAQDACAPFLTHAVEARRNGEHVVDAYLRLADALCPLPVGSRERDGVYPLAVAVTPDDMAFADNFLRDHELSPPIVGLVIGATRPQKRWPETYFARLADKLWSAAGAVSVLLGGPEEDAAARRILHESRSPLVSAVGRTTEKQLAALVARLGVVVSGDSGPLHIATAMGTPVVALFGSTDPAETGPWVPAHGTVTPSVVLYDALSCAPCRKSPTCDGRFDCLRAITPERAFDAALSLVPESILTHARRRTLPMAAALPGGGEVTR